MSLEIKFPSNPTNGMIFEIIPGIFYKYNAGSNCWARLTGATSLGLATPLSNGLMSKEDYSKLQNLIIPPPQATLKGEECESTFKSGTVAFYSFDDSIEISKNPKIINQTPRGQVDVTQPWVLHKSTAGFDFRISLSRIIQEIEERNAFKKIQLRGDKGPKGLRGDPGRDRLDTGPVGIKGESGVNSPFDGVLTSEDIPFELVTGSSNRAIVDVSTEEISEDENYLVITRANIGNPDACPSLVIPKDFNSALIVALNTIESGKLIKDESISSKDCALICRICASTIHHLNIEPLLQQIYDQFLARINALKRDKEALAKTWLNTMVCLFNEQKAALCCALENCQSRKRNERTRQFIESQRIQAAQADFQLLIDGAGENRILTDMNAGKNCAVSTVDCAPVTQIEGGVALCLDSKLHISDPRVKASQAVTAFLPAGDYIAEITECCPNFNDSVNSPKFSGQAAILYRNVVESGQGSSPQNNVQNNVVSFPNMGVFNSEAAAKNAYQSLTISFAHAGGDISAWLVDPDGFTANNSGKLVISITSATAATDETNPPADGFLYVYRDELTFDGLLGRVVPFTGAISAKENFGNDPDEVNLTVGPTLQKDVAQIFFYDGSDGLNMFFVAGELPAVDNEQEANLLIDVDVTNNTVGMSVKASDAQTDIKQLSSGQFQATSSINGNSAGFAIGELDTSAEFSIRVDPLDLSTMRQFIVIDAGGNDIILSEGGSEGIGGAIAATQVNSAPLFSIDDVPSQFGGGNTSGMRINNESAGQNIYVTRPLVVDASITLGGATTTSSTIITSGTNTTSGTQNVTPATTGAASANSTTLEIKDSDFAITPINLNPGFSLGGSTASLFNSSSSGPANWIQTTKTSGRPGSTSRTSTHVGGNPGNYHETTHVSAAEPRKLAITHRPTKSYFGPGSTGALPWDQSFAVDQFGNTWVFIRAVDGRQGGGAPHHNGSDDVFLRDATAEEIPEWAKGIPNRAGTVVFGGSSGVASGATVSSAASQSAVITTVHIKNLLGYTPRTQGAINFTSLTFDGLIVSVGPFVVGAALLQNGIIYISNSTVDLSETNWTNKGIPNLVPSNFGSLNTDGTGNFSSNPNFSNGSEVKFGYYVVSTHTGTGSETKIVGIDNWVASFNVKVTSVVPIITKKVVVEAEPPPPTPFVSKCVPSHDEVPETGEVEVPERVVKNKSPQILDICVSIRSFSPQNLRYILTDKDGTKYYSTFKSINVGALGNFQLLQFGQPLQILNPPPEFTSEIILGRNLPTNLIASQLTDAQLRIADSLSGISRLSYVQEILGSPTTKIPSTSSITDIELEFQNMPSSSVDLGYVSLKIGKPGSITEILLDNFEIKEIVVGKTQIVPERIEGTVKRVVASQDGSDSLTGGLIYSGISNYFGDYYGFDTFSKTNVNFNGNNFFLLNRAGDKLTEVTEARGFNDVRINPGGEFVTSVSLNVEDLDAVVVNDFGVVYIADAPNGQILAIHAANAQILNTTFGDVHDQSSNVIRVIADGLPKGTKGVITLGKKFQLGANMVDEIIGNFSGVWFRVNGVASTLLKNSSASRDDVTTSRCCFGGNTPGPARTIALATPAGSVSTFGSSSGGNSLTTTKNSNPQPSLPVPGIKLNQGIVDAIQSELDQDFNDFDLYSLDDSVISIVDQGNGGKTTFRELGENGFGLRVNPLTKDLYYITDDRGANPKSGTTIKRVDINDLDEENNPKIKTVYQAVGEGIFGITFGVSVPTDPTTKNQVLYALLSTLVNPGSGNNIRARLVEISENVVPPVPSQPISQQIPLNSTWNSHVTGGRLLGNPQRVIFSRVSPGGGCQMHYKQVQWYERGWRIGACCGALVEVNGVHYVVAKRSIGTDTSCGGGESSSTPCIAQFILSGEGHPAIAWPTLPLDGPPPGGGGEEFLGIPTSGFVNFVKDETLSTTILDIIKSGGAIRIIGRPQDIPFILFPAA